MKGSRKERWREVGYGLTLVSLLALFLALGVRNLEGRSWHSDEGMFLMSAWLVEQGYTLYRQVWFDYPPLIFVSLAFAFRLFGASVVMGRAVFLVFATLGLGAISLVVRQVAGRVGALASVVLLASIPAYWQWSRAAVYGEVAAAGVATLALWCALRYLNSHGRTRWWLALSGGLFALGLLIKPTIGFAALPVGLAVILTRGPDTSPEGWAQRLLGLGLVAVSGLVVLGTVLAFFDVSAFLSQMVSTFVGASEGGPDTGRSVPMLLGYFLKEHGVAHPDWLAWILCGGLSLWRRNRRVGAVLLSWLVATVGTLLSLTFVGERHLVLLLFPLGVLAGVTVDSVVREVTSLVRERCLIRDEAWWGRADLLLGMVAVASTLVVLPQNLQQDRRVVPREGWNPTKAQDAVDFLRQTTTPEDVLIADDDGVMIAFRAGRKVIPSLSNPTGMRVETGNLTSEMVIALAEQVRPKAIVLGPKKHLATLAFLEWLKVRYSLARAYDENCRIYVRWDGQAEPPGFRKEPPPPELCLGVPPDQPFTPPHSTKARLGDHFLLEGWDMDRKVVRPGGQVLLTLYWRLLDPTPSDYHVFVHVRGEELIAQRDGVPRCGQYPTYRWRPGEEVVDPYVVDIADGVSEGSYPVWVGMYDMDSGERLPIADAQGQPLGTSLLLTRLRVGKPRVEVPPIPYPQDATLGGKIRFLGYSPPSTEAHPGEPVRLTLYWQCLEEMEASYTVFVHLLDEEGQIRGQGDALPQDGQLPTDLWVAGEVVVDSYEVPVAPEAEPGQYTLAMGMYDGVTGIRLPARDEQGASLPDDRVLLRGVRVR